MGVIAGGAVPVTSGDGEEQPIAGQNVQIQVEEALSPDQKRRQSREEPTPESGGSPQPVPAPKESGRPSGPQEGLQGSAEDVQYGAEHDADEQHDADDGDDDEDEQLQNARRAGGYPPQGHAASHRPAQDSRRAAHDNNEEEIDESEDAEDHDNDDGNGDLSPLNVNNDDGFEQYSSRCVLLFKVDNSSSCSQTIQRTVRPKRDENGNPVPLNFKCPLSSIPCEVYSNSNANVLVLTKLDPKIAEWGEFEWHFEVIQKQGQYAAGQPWNGYAPYGDAYMHNGGEYYGEGTGGSTGAANPDYDAAYGEAVGASATKACPACTYEQPAHMTNCEICNTKL